MSFTVVRALRFSDEVSYRCVVFDNETLEDQDPIDVCFSLTDMEDPFCEVPNGGDDPMTARLWSLRRVHQVIVQQKRAFSQQGLSDQNKGMKEEVARCYKLVDSGDIRRKIQELKSKEREDLSAEVDRELLEEEKRLLARNYPEYPLNFSDRPAESVLRRPVVRRLSGELENVIEVPKEEPVPPKKSNTFDKIVVLVGALGIIYVWAESFLNQEQ